MLLRSSQASTSACLHAYFKSLTSHLRCTVAQPDPTHVLSLPDAVSPQNLPSHQPLHAECCDIPGNLLRSRKKLAFLLTDPILNWEKKVRRALKAIFSPIISPHRDHSHLQWVKIEISIPFLYSTLQRRAQSTKLPEGFGLSTTELLPTSILSFSILTMQLWA